MPKQKLKSNTESWVSELGTYSAQGKSFQDEIVQRNERILKLEKELAAAKSNYDEQTKSVHQISERMQKEYAVERERVAAWQKTCNEQTERLEASRVRADAALQEAAEARARALNAEGSLFAWRLATILMTGAAIAMGGILLWGS